MKKIGSQTIQFENLVKYSTIFILENRKKVNYFSKVGSEIPQNHSYRYFCIEKNM